MENYFSGYRCSICKREFDPSQVQYTCPYDGGNLDVLFDYDAIRHRYAMDDITSRVNYSLWRYSPLLPVNDPGLPPSPLGNAGWTPVFQPQQLKAALGLSDLWVKDEGRNPTASFKDRASAVVLARAMEIHADITVTASTGNAGAALAGMAAATSQKAVILAPRTAPPAKIAQLMVYHAHVILVDGNYDDAFDLSINASREFGWYCRNTGFNPFTAEGKKTAAFEIWENVLSGLNLSQQPLNIFVSVGDGNIISGLHKGFKDLEALGWLDKMPRLFGVQSSGSAAIANAFQAGTEEITPVKADTIADSISVNLPRDGVRAVRAARETGGSYLVVEDAEILQAIADLGRNGIFAEPAGAACLAGLKKAIKDGMTTPCDPVLLVVTGSGLKDIRSAVKAVGEAPVIEPTLNALKNLLEKM
ncbi:MAG: threonine synthase [Chloroflexi bacterium]|nr:threonine synthase [Chloroflexota bacterium]